MGTRAKVGLFFGGRSLEHEVSLRSLKSMVGAIDTQKYELFFFPISKSGKLYTVLSMELFENAISVDDVLDSLIECSFDQLKSYQLYCAFSVLHGSLGENGAYQGFFEVLQIPYVGAGVLGSSLAMDKEVAKRLLVQAGLPVTPFKQATAQTLSQELLSSQGFPCFVKAATLGSSVGVYKCHTLDEAIDAARQVFELDTKLLIEKSICGRELEVAVFGGDNLIASYAGEVIPHHEFYSYEAKYLDENGASFKLPADDVDHELLKNLAIRACEALEIKGMARVDFFQDQTGHYYINELNTLPGFTDISMYPKLFQVSGIGYGELISRLIEEGVERFEKNAQLQKTLYDTLVDEKLG